MGGKIRVLVADDHQPFRRALIQLLGLNDEIEVVGEAEDGEEALRLCAALLPDVIVMDLIMPKMGGAQATKIIKRDTPSVRVVMLSVFGQERHVEEGLKAGADEYLSKGVGRERLLEALLSARSGAEPVHAGAPSAEP